jgi:hypothetical protein
MIKKILKIADDIQEYLRILKAFTVGYDAFMAELRGVSSQKEREVNYDGE